MHRNAPSYASFAGLAQHCCLYFNSDVKVKLVSLTADDVRKVAHLARLGLDDARIAEYTGELSNILDVFETLGKANTDDVAPMSHPLDLSARLRADEARPVTDRDVFQSLAPATADGVYLVPKVIE